MLYFNTNVGATLWRDQASIRLEGFVEMIGLCPDSLGFL